MLLRHHPLAEVRVVAEALESVLQKAFPNSFGHKRYEATEEYNRSWMETGYYFSGSRDSTDYLEVTRDSIDKDFLRSEYLQFIKNRPPKTELPKQMAEAGTMQFEFLIDFGSFRDLQRQRSVIQRMPLLSRYSGMHPWYLNSLSTEQARVAESMLREQLTEIGNLPSEDRFVQQYYLPMGTCVSCRLTGDLPALVYVVEQRAQRDVHPTLHEVALWMADALLERFGDLGLTLGVDREKGRFDVKRGLQDIVQKD